MEIGSTRLLFSAVIADGGVQIKRGVRNALTMPFKLIYQGVFSARENEGGACSYGRGFVVVGDYGWTLVSRFSKVHLLQKPFNTVWCFSFPIACT